MKINETEVNLESLEALRRILVINRVADIIVYIHSTSEDVEKLVMKWLKENADLHKDKKILIVVESYMTCMLLADQLESSRLRFLAVAIHKKMMQESEADRDQFKQALKAEPIHPDLPPVLTEGWPDDQKSFQPFNRQEALDEIANRIKKEMMALALDAFSGKSK